MRIDAQPVLPPTGLSRTLPILALPLLLALSTQTPAALLWSPLGPPALISAEAGSGKAIRFSLDASSVDAVDFEFSVSGAMLQAQRVHSEPFGGGWNWSGTIDGDPSQTLEITWTGDRLAGRLQTSGGLWEIRPVAARESLLLPVDASAFPAELPPRVPSAPLELREPAANADAEVNEPTASNTWRIDVLVTYLAGVASEAGGVANLDASVRNIVYGANEAARRSAFNGRYHLVGLLQSPLPDTGSFNDLLDAVTADPWTAARRNALAADLVSLLVPHATHPESCGVGWLMGDHDTYTYQAWAFQVTNFNCAKSNHSWAHEHGHNLGFQHDRAHGGEPYLPYAFGWAVNGVFRTIMAYPAACDPSCPRAGMFSTPLRHYLGHPAGVANVADNARVGNITAPIAAAYRTGNVLFADGFDG